MAIAYRIPDAAKACGVGETRIRRAIAEDELTPAYPDSEPRLLAEDLRAWAETWPREKPRR